MLWFHFYKTSEEINSYSWAHTNEGLPKRVNNNILWGNVTKEMKQFSGDGSLPYFTYSDSFMTIFPCQNLYMFNICSSFYVNYNLVKTFKLKCD
jgi:hypothetical protein